MSDLLTPMQLAFVEAFCNQASGNATEAVRAAGYKVTGNGVCVLGAKLKGNPKIQAAIRQYHKDHRVSGDQVITRLWLEARREGPGTSHGARVAALHHLSKILGLLLDRRHITADIRTTCGGDVLEDLISDPNARAALDQLAKVQEERAQAEAAASGNGGVPPPSRMVGAP